MDAMTEARTTTTEYRIPAHKLDGFKAVVERVSRKAVKLGLEGISYRVLDEEPAVVIRQYLTNSWGDTDAVEYLYATPEQAKAILSGIGADPIHPPEEVGATSIFTVAVTGQEPYIDGWTFVATLDHDGETNIVNAVPGQTAITVADWIKAPADCGHCKLNRQRIKTYLLTDETGGILQLGSTCVGDFFPGLAAQQIATLANLLVIIALQAGDTSWGSGDSVRFEGWRRERVLETAAAAVRTLGFVSKSLARTAEEEGRHLTSTASAVATFLSRKASDPVVFSVTDEDAEKATQVIEWVDDLEPDYSNDYLWNLKSAIARPVTTVRTLGLVVSAVSAFDREEQKRVEREQENWIPVPDDGERRTITGRILSTRLQESDYYNRQPSLKALVLVDTPDGSFKLWGTVPEALWGYDKDVQPGDTFTFTARLERSQDDQYFGFYKRPTKASIEYPEGTRVRCRTCDAEFATVEEAHAEDEANRVGIQRNLDDGGLLSGTPAHLHGGSVFIARP